ncbi:MAG: molecular chaperone [Hyphomicrobiaceae bacterium]
MKRAIAWMCVAALTCALGTSSQAATLQVSPVLIDAGESSAAEKLVLRNKGATPINAQIRLFGWRQSEGQDVLEPTRAIVASPPFASIPPGGEQVVRIVRVDRSKPAREASYRLIVDELPDKSERRTSGVNFVMRYSVPVFFGSPAGAAPRLDWKVRAEKGAVVVTAVNTGARRVRVSELVLRNSGGEMLAARRGLVGYVLGNSTATWKIPAGKVSSGSRVLITGNGDVGPIHGQAVAP